MPSLVCLLAVGMLALPSLGRAAADPDIYREWAHFMNAGVWTTSDRGCVLRLIEERRYKLTRAESDNMPPAGIFASILHARWIRKNSDGCVHPVFGAVDIVDRARLWGVDLTPKSPHEYLAKGKWFSCSGDGCNEKDLFKGSFSANLRYTGQTLVDEGDAAIDKGALTFLPLASAQRESSKIANEFLARWSALSKVKDLEQFARMNVARGGGMSDADVIRILERYRSLSLSEAAAGYRVMEAYTIVPGTGATSMEPLLFFQAANARSDGRKGLETFELIQVDGVWKLLNLKY